MDVEDVVEANDIDFESTPDTEELVEYLEGHAGPYDEIWSAWLKTCTERNQILLSSSTTQYFNKFPALCTNQGLELVIH